MSRLRIDTDFTTKFIIDDLIERGLFKSHQEVLTKAINLLQTELAERGHENDPYYNENHQKMMDELQLASND